MLSKFTKYLPVFCLWLAVFILTAHQIIPHDHHVASAYADQDKNCSAPDHKSDHRSGFPVHCHALNDLLSEKSRLYNIPNNFQFNFVALINYTDTDTFHTQIQGELIFACLESVIDSATLELSDLRAPPVLS
jgi:hypothetical protein